MKSKVVALILSIFWGNLESTDFILAAVAGVDAE